MRTALKVLGFGALGLLAIFALIIGASFLFPERFQPKIKTTPLRSPSGAVYNIMQRGPIRAVRGGARTLGIEYLAEAAVTVEGIGRAADELEALVRPETSTGGFNSLVVMAYRTVRQHGFVSEGESINTIFERAASVDWDIFAPREPAPLPPKAAAVKAELLEAYGKLDDAVRRLDPRAIWEMETDDYTDTLMDGTVMKKDADLTYMQKEFAGLSLVSAFDVKIESLMLEPGRATVVLKSSFSGTVNNEKRQGETYYSQSYSRDVWRKTKDGWRISESVDLGSKSFFFKP